MSEVWPAREMVITISPCGSLEPSPQVAVQASRSGGIGVLDLADGGWRRMQALAQAAFWSASMLAIRVPAACAVTAAEVRRSGADRVGLTVLTARSSGPSHRPGRRQGGT